MDFKYWKLLGFISITILCLFIPIYLSRVISTENPILVQGTKMSEVKISVCVDDDHLSQIEKISQQLRSSGMNVEQVLSTIGVVSGSIQPDKLNNLYQIEGVNNIEPEQHYQLSPPSSGIQ